MTPVLGLRTFEAARNKDFNVLQRHENLLSCERFLSELWGYRDILAGIPKHHLRLEEAASCRVFDRSEWISGSFNICIPIEVKSRKFSGEVIVRCPLPSKLAGSRCFGTVDEKMRTEIATYAFMQKECPGIRIPRLYGFAFSNVQVGSSIRFSHISADGLKAVHSRRTFTPIPSDWPRFSAMDPQDSSPRSSHTICST